MPLARYPDHLLSNGNHGRPIATLTTGVTKPATDRTETCYLFALVAGRSTGCRALLPRRAVRSCSKSTRLFAVVRLCHKGLPCAGTYGREYDLDAFMIFCADDFNLGAMENKGTEHLPATASCSADASRHRRRPGRSVDAIVAHEYFHNWSGNRVTCRDWSPAFAEGFTVFREQQYIATRPLQPLSASTKPHSSAVAAVRAVTLGRMAYAIRPDEYEAIDNFYTVTVYEKGAEVIRHVAHIACAEAHRKRVRICTSPSTVAPPQRATTSSRCDGSGR